MRSVSVSVVGSQQNFVGVLSRKRRHLLRVLSQTSPLEKYLLVACGILLLIALALLITLAVTASLLEAQSSFSTSENVCGKGNKNTPFKLSGPTIQDSEFPWNVGLYAMNYIKHWQQICSGSLISPHIVVTAAHCVFSVQSSDIFSPTYFKVGLGKRYREWTVDEPHAVKSDVRAILIPEEYLGRVRGYALDIALLDLPDSVQINQYIMPVCVDWKHQFPVTPGTLGVLAGWATTGNGTSSDLLSYALLPYMDFRECIMSLVSVFRHYITADKFCAGFNNGTDSAAQLSQYNGGGGLISVQNDLYYLHGIGSTKIVDLAGGKTFLTFTNIANEEVFVWLTRAKSEFDGAHIET